VICFFQYPHPKKTRRCIRIFPSSPALCSRVRGTWHGKTDAGLCIICWHKKRFLDTDKTKTKGLQVKSTFDVKKNGHCCLANGQQPGITPQFLGIFSSVSFDAASAGKSSTNSRNDTVGKATRPHKLWPRPLSQKVSKAMLVLIVAGSLAMSARAQSNIVYAVEYNQSTNSFGIINLLNGSFTKISSIGGAVVNDIACCPTNGALYGISNSTALVTFNKTNGAMTRVAALSVSGIESLAFRPSDGVLFGATASRLYTINTTNGTATSVGLFGTAHNLGTGQNIRFAQDGNLYVSNTSTNTDIYRISTSAGSATWMGEAIGFPYLILENSSSNMYGVYISLGSSTNPYPVLVTFNLSSFVIGGTNANGSTHQITLNLVGAGTNFPANFNFSGNTAQAVTNLTIQVGAAGPVSQTVCPGDSATFSTVASGTGPYSYAWLKNNAAISGQTNSSLTLNNVNAGDAATYSVIVNGLMGSVTNSATLTVNTPVTATPLSNVTDCPGDSAIFSTVASGTGPFSYVWLKNGALLAGQNSNTLTLNNVSASDAATYSVVVSGACGSAVTNSAILTVNASVMVTIPPASQTTVVGNNVTFGVTATGTGLSYEWLFGGSVIGTASSLTLNYVTTSQAGVYTVIVSGVCGTPVTNTATLMVNVPVSVTVAPVSQTTVVGSNVTFSVTATGTSLSYQWLFGGSVIGTSSSLTLNNVTTSQAGTYTVIVSGAAGSPVTNNATLTVNVPVSVTVAPVSQTTVVGSNVTFSVTASGTGLSYEWLFGGSVIGNTSSLTLNSVTTSQAGIYTVIVSGLAGSPVTNNATLTVNVPVSVTVPPVDQTTVVGSNVTFSVTASGTGLSYQWLFGGSVIGTSSSLTLNNVTTSQAGVYTVIVSGAGSPVTNSATLTVNVPVSVTVAPVSQTTIVGSNVTFSVTATGTGLSYQWLFGGSVIGTGSSLTLNNVTTDQAGIYTVIVSGAGTPVTNSATLTVNVPVTVSVAPVSQTTVVGSNVTFSVTASGTGLSYQWLFGGSVLGTSSSLTLNNVTTDQAGIYTVIVSGAGSPVTNSATLTVNVPVSVTVPPVDQTTVVGSNVTFSVTATGTALSYQWLFNGSVIGTDSSLMLNNVTSVQGGIYTVIVNGACGSVTNSATLTVNVPVTATALTNQICSQGQNAVFSTVASGTGPINFVWLKNGSVISGQNDNSLTLDNVTTNDAATYAVIVCGACGSVTNTATLTVNPALPPTLSIVNMRNGTVNVSAANGAPGQSFVLLVSTNLVNWTVVSTNTADSTGASMFVGLDATNHLHYFYRTVTP
jgi:hypothetical protein